MRSVPPSCTPCSAPPRHARAPVRLPWFALALPLLLGASWPAAPLSACTIFVLTDEDDALFFNNEDWSNPATRLWFVPAGEGHLGCVYLGFDDDWAQGGMNTAGLAFDWVAGFADDYAPDPALRRVRGNPSQRMLETCTTVDEAIAFYRTHREPSFGRARLLVADRRGASVVIGARDGRLFFDRSNASRGFGYGARVLQQRLAMPPAPSLETGVEILRACVQEGPTATRYSNVFDLKRGALFIYAAPRDPEPIRIDLEPELGRGGHWFELPRLAAQLAQPPHPLPPGLQRFYLDSLPTLAAAPNELTQHIRNLIERAAAGRMQADDYAAPLWQQLAPASADIARQLEPLGALRSVTLVATEASAEPHLHRCILEFARARVLQRYQFAADGKLSALATEFVEPDPELLAMRR